MSNETLIRAWKDAKFRATLKGAAPASPAGDRLVELDADELRATWGGLDQQQEPTTASEGYVCTVSGETGGGSCWTGR